MRYLASNPARITVNPLVWFRHGGAAPLALLGALVLAVVAFLTIKPASEKMATRLRLIPVALALFNVIYWAGVFMKGKSGDLNGGMVLQEDPMLIGVIANMDKGSAPAEWYAVKIKPCKVCGPDGNPLPAGTRIAAACTYGDTKDSERRGRWGDFAPDPIQCLTQDRAAIEEAMSRVDAQQWVLLEKAVAAIPEFKPGVYFMAMTEAAGLTPSA